MTFQEYFRDVGLSTSEVKTVMDYERSRLSALNECMDDMLNDMRFDVFRIMEYRYCELAGLIYPGDLPARMRDLCRGLENAELNGDLVKRSEYSVRLAECARYFVYCFLGVGNG